MGSKKNHSTNEQTTSARYYLFEELLYETSSFTLLKQTRSVHDLQLLAGLVWAREGGKGPCPLVLPRRSKKDDYSYFKDGKILLASHHHTFASLLHELAHALGSSDKLTHGPAFRRRCIHLYKTYGEWNGEVDFGLARKDSRGLKNTGQEETGKRG